MKILNIQTIEDLNKVLFIQKVITRRAKDELYAIIKDADMTAPFEDKEVDNLMKREGELLQKYANYPTMSEFNAMPNLAAGTKWGATFGLALLVNELVLEQVKRVGPEGTPVIPEVFAPVLRPMYMILLAELDNPTHNYLIEPLEKALQITLTTKTGAEVPPAERDAFVHRMVTNLVEAMLHVSSVHKIVVYHDEGGTSGYAITPLGKRVLLHLMDVQQVIALMHEAYIRLRDSNAVKTS